MSLGEIYFKLPCFVCKSFIKRKGGEYREDQFLPILERFGKFAFERMASKVLSFSTRHVISGIGEDAFDYGLLVRHRQFKLFDYEIVDVRATFADRSVQVSWCFLFYQQAV